MLKANEKLGVSFELPDRLTVDQLDNYQQRIGGYLAEYKETFLSTVRYRAMAYSAAVEAGFVTDWQSDTMPDMKPTDIDSADAAVINYAGFEIDAYITAYTAIPPN